MEDTSGSSTALASGTINVIVPKPLPLQIADYLRERILHDVIKPGERIREQTVADSLSVSRTPLRDALKILETEGLVKIDLNRGATIVSLDGATVRGALHVQATLEALAGSIAAERYSSQLESLLVRNIERLRKAAAKADGRAWFKADTNFYQGVVTFARSKTISDLYLNTCLLTHRSRFLLRVKMAPSHVDFGAFEEIRLAMRDRRPELAKQLIMEARLTELSCVA